MLPRSATPDPEALAITALGFLAGDGERLARFLSLTGLEPASLRKAAREPAFLGSVLDYLMADEALLLAFCADNLVAPGAIAQARTKLPG